MSDHSTHPPSISPPRTTDQRDARAVIDAVSASVDKLAGMSDDDRSRELAALPEEWRAWGQFLRTVLCLPEDRGGPSCDPDARMLLAHAEANGLRRDEAKQLIARVITVEPLRSRWTQWTQTIDRDELRLRLELLSRSREWHEDFAPFVTFFFRASVADLYQHAAIALGRHLHHSAKLREYLTNFSAQRSVPMDHAVKLSGERSSRRMMIALAAARANPPRDMAITREPIALEGDEDGRPRLELPRQPADLATVLLALDVMVAGEPHDEQLIRQTRDALGRVSHLDVAGLSRAVVQRFGGLLARCGGEETQDNWSRLFHAQQRELRMLEEGRFGRRVAGLFKIDELLHCLSVMSDPWPERIVRTILQIPNGIERRFIAMRVLTWALREHHAIPAWAEPLLGARDNDRHQRSELPSMQLSPNAMLASLERSIDEKSRSREPVFAQATAGSDIAMLDCFLREMQRQATWLSHEEPERALFAMVMIDLTQHVQLLTEQIAALLERHDFALSDEARTAAASGHVAATSVLLRLLTWEKPGAEDLIDVRMLHRIDDVRVLLALIPTARFSPLLPTLADAFEHQLRWRLRRDEHFSPDTLLALTQIRQPDPQFYRSLQVLCEGRTYRRADGSEVAVLPLVKHVRAEADQLPAEALANSPPSDTPYAKSIARLRERLRAASEDTDDVRRRIERLLDAVGEPSAAPGARAGTVIGILKLLHEPNMPLLHDGHPAWTEESLAEFLRDLDGDLARIKTLAHTLLPEDWRSGDEVREAAAALRALLDRRLNELARSLPATEAAIMRELHARVDHEISAWSAIIESVIDRWPESALRTAGGVAYDAAKDALAAIGRIDQPLLRSHLLGILWQSLRDWAAPAGAASEADAWSMQRRLLDEAIAQPLSGDTLPSSNEREGANWSDADHRRARAAFAAAWCELAEQAMERNEEKRVIELATDARYQPLRHQTAADETLRAMRKWCHDRYLLRDAAHVRDDLRAAAGRPPRGAFAECGPLLANFPTIWLAMLIGAIFMLDFGDAWAAMADPEVGDIRGITITFLIGIGGAFGYVYWNLKQKSRPAPGESSAALRRSQLARAGAFSAVCLIYTLLLVSGLWWLLSETDEVVEGIWAIGHIIVWSGFALFVGVFFGLLAGDA